MTRPGKPRPVVVGVDEAGSAEDAVDWATAEAAALGCPLRVVHAFRPPLPADAYGFASPIDSFVAAHTAAQCWAAAVTGARSVAPGIEVSTRLVKGTAARPCSARPGTRSCSSWAAAADENDLLPLGTALADDAALLSPRGQVSEHGAARWFCRLAGGVFDTEDLIERTDRVFGGVVEMRGVRLWGRLVYRLAGTGSDDHRGWRAIETWARNIAAALTTVPVRDGESVALYRPPKPPAGWRPAPVQ